MGLYKYLKEAYQKPENSDIWTKRVISWRQGPATVRLEHPTRLDRARSLGYKAKPGIIVVRQRLMSGGRRRPDIKSARRSKHARQRKVLSMNYQQVAEARAGRKYPNTEVLNSYFLAKDGNFYWFEIILVDKEHPAIFADKNLNWMADPKNSKRAERGLTSAARRSRGLLNKGKGAEKLRPSLRSRNRTGK
jgi:large subunit ribosomal protein L15e